MRVNSKDVNRLNKSPSRVEDLNDEEGEHVHTIEDCSGLAGKGRASSGKRTRKGSPEKID